MARPSASELCPLTSSRPASCHPGTALEDPRRCRAGGETCSAELPAQFELNGRLEPEASWPSWVVESGLLRLFSTCDLRKPLAALDPARADGASASRQGSTGGERAERRSIKWPTWAEKSREIQERATGVREIERGRQMKRQFVARGTQPRVRGRREGEREKLMNRQVTSCPLRFSRGSWPAASGQHRALSVSSGQWIGWPESRRGRAR